MQIPNQVNIGFDFSINKPAMTIEHKGIYDFFIWPLHMKDSLVEKYKKYDVNVFNRNLPSIDTKKMSSSEIAYEHTRRSTSLANLIVRSIVTYLANRRLSECKLNISSEGLSFGSSGDQALNLATYKGVLLSKLYEAFPIDYLGTYAPITIKKTAGCSSKEKRGDKKCMIESFLMNEKIQHKFQYGLRIGAFTLKVNYAECVDDLIDSYFALKTMKEKL